MPKNSWKTVKFVFQVSADKKSLMLGKDNMLETMTFSIKGCGNFQDAEIALEDNPNLKIFSPDATASIPIGETEDTAN